MATQNQLNKEQRSAIRRNVVYGALGSAALGAIANGAMYGPVGAAVGAVKSAALGGALSGASTYINARYQNSIRNSSTYRGRGASDASSL